VVGQGAMGSVYKVEQVFLRKIFALKTLNTIAASDLVIRRFQKEARAASRLEHPNLVRAVDFGIIEGSQPFFVMEFVQGISLDRYLKQRSRLSIEEMRAIFIPICRGMSYAHHEGVVHRDIKPSNIVLVPTDLEGQYIPKVVDFGIAKLDVIGEGDEQTLTATGEVFGTPLYMSPEQCAGDVIDKRSDIYALGCVLFEAMTGAPPFRGRNALETMMLHRTTEPISLKEASLGMVFSPGLENVVAQMLAKDPSLRYRDCLDVASDLESLGAKSTGGKLKARTVPGDVYSKLNAIGNLNLTISGKFGSILLLAWLLISVLLVFALNSGHEPVQLANKDSSKPAENQGDVLFNDLDKTPDLQLAFFIERHPFIEQMPPLTDWYGTDSGLSALEGAKSLKFLRLKECHHITDDGLKYLVHLPLQRLDLDEMNITDKGMASVSQIRTLQYLNLRQTDVGDKGCLLLAQLPELRMLLLSETIVTGTCLPAIAKMPELKELHLDFDLPVRNHLSALANSKISILSLAKDEVTDDDLDALLKMHALTYLSLDDNVKITDKGLLKLAQLPHLNTLRIRNCRVTSAGMRKFKLLNPACKLVFDYSKFIRGI
jgi:serine/threonine protein kinase